MPVVPKSFSYAQKKYPSEARNKSGKQLISCNSKRQIIERTEKQNASSRYFNSSRAHHAAERKFDEPIGSAGNRPQGGLCKPPARPVVMIRLIGIKAGKEIYLFSLHRRFRSANCAAVRFIRTFALSASLSSMARSSSSMQAESSCSMSFVAAFVTGSL